MAECLYIAKKNETMELENPFFTITDIPEEFFCDRKVETAKIISLLNNGSNVVLKAPRRIGKSSLIKHVFKQKVIVDRYNTLFVDIYGTKNAADFHSEFQNALLSAPFARNSRIKRTFSSMVKSAYIELGDYDTLTGKVSFPKIGFSPSTLPKIPIKDLFGYLEETSRPNLIVFDEFQQIQQYPERMAAILRGYIQQMRNTRFIFSGSSRHMLTTMFQLSNQPFYKSAAPMDLDILSLDSYKEFCHEMFKYGNKNVDDAAVTFAYYLFLGETYLLQEVMKESYSRTASGGACTKEIVLSSIEELLNRKESDYRDILNRLNNQKERNTLYCIAVEGIARGLTSSSIMKRYNLDNASSVQNALENLGEDKLGLIDKIAKGTFIVQDRLFELWISKKTGMLETKYLDAENRFNRQREIISSVNLP